MTVHRRFFLFFAPNPVGIRVIQHERALQKQHIRILLGHHHGDALAGTQVHQGDLGIVL